MVENSKAKNSGSIKKQSLSRKLTLSLVSLILAVTALVNTFNLYRAYRLNRLELVEKVELYEKSLVKSLAILLWHYEKKGTRSLAEAYLLNRDIVVLEIRDGNNEVFVDVQKEHTGSIIQRSKEVFYEGQFTGTVKVGLTTQYLDQSNRQLLWASVLMIFFVVLTLVFATRLVLNLFLRKPIKQLNLLALSIADGKKATIPQPIVSEFEKPVSIMIDMGARITSQIGQIQKAEKEYRNIFENSLVGIFQMNKEGRILKANESFIEILGFESFAEISRFSREYPYKLFTDASGRSQFANRVMHGSRVIDLEVALYQKTGNHIWGLIHGKMIKAEPNGEDRFEGMLVDNSDRKAAELALTESEQKYRMLIENLPQKIFFKTIDSTYITCNHQFASDLKIEVSEITGKTDFDFFPKELAEKYRADDRRILRGRKTEELEERYISNGEEHVVQTVKTVVLDDKGKTIGLLGIFWDISDRKRAEKALMDLQKELEVKIEERTRELMESKLVAEKANRTKSEFLANISHELRNPMHHILSYSKYGVEKFNEVQQEKLLHYFTQIQKSGSRLMVLLNDLLDLSKMEAGRTEYDFNPNNVEEIVEDAVSELKQTANEKELKIVVEEANVPTEINCDVYKIGQVVRNILSNAIRFSPEESEIVIRFQEDTLIKNSKQVKSLRVDIQDAGLGIPNDELDYIFEKFAQSSKTKTGAGGTGLGLSICYEIIKAHKGKIWVKNGPEGGAIFSFMIPYTNR